MSRRIKILFSIAVLVASLGLAQSAEAATWSTEPVPAGPGALGPARLSFDSRGRGLLLWNGVPTSSQPRFTGMATRAPGGGWTRLGNLPGVGWGNAQALQYATTRVLFVSGQVASVGAFNRAKLRLVAAYGRSDGSGLGRWQTLAPRETGFVATASPSGQAIVLFADAGGRLATVERPAGGAFGKATTIAPPGAFTPAVAINARGDRIVAWVRSGEIQARVRDAGRRWGAVLNVGTAPRVSNVSLRAAVSTGGTFLLAWDAATIRESQPTRLIAGAAQRRPGASWHAYRLESSTLATTAATVPENPAAIPLVTGNGAIAVTWTGAVGGGARFGVKAARLTSAGLRPTQVVSDPTAAAALGDAAVGPEGQAAIAYSQSDAASHTTTFAARSPGPGLPFGPPDLLTPSGAAGLSGPAIGFQPVSGQAVAIVPIIQGTSGGYVAAIS